MTITASSDTATMHRIHAAAFTQGWGENDFRGMLAIPAMFALVIGQEGFILCRALHEQCEILTLAVLPASQRRGLGTALVEVAKEEAKKRGANRLFLEVAEDNTGALKLYERAGFSVISRRRDYYKNADGGYSDAVVMERSLS